MLNNVLIVTRENLLNTVAAVHMRAYRFVTMTCQDTGKAYDILYHFDKEYQLHHLRLKLPKGQELPSISVIYFAAALVENEIQDLFGIKVTGLAIDYEGRFILGPNSPKAPLNKEPPTGEELSVPLDAIPVGA